MGIIFRTFKLAFYVTAFMTLAVALIIRFNYKILKYIVSGK